MVNLHLLTQHVMPSYTQEMVNVSVTIDSVTSMHSMCNRALNVSLIYGTVAHS